MSIFSYKFAEFLLERRSIRTQMENSDHGGASGRWLFTFLAIAGLCFLLAVAVTELQNIKREIAKKPILDSNFKRVEIETHEPKRVQCVDQTGKGEWTKIEVYNLTCARAATEDNFDCFYPNGTVRSVPLVDDAEARPHAFIRCEHTRLDDGGRIVWPSTCFMCFGEECNPAKTAELAMMSKEMRDQGELWGCTRFAMIGGAMITGILYFLSH